MDPLTHILPAQTDPPSPVMALAAGAVAGLVLGAILGLRLGKSIGYRPNLPKYLLAVGLVILAGALGFLGWHWWETGGLPDVGGIFSPEEDHAGTIRNCAVMGGLLSGILLLSLVVAFPSGRQQRTAELDAAEADRRAEQARQAAAALREAEEEAAKTRERAEAERRRAEEEARRRAEEEAAVARERAEAERRRAEEEAKRRAEEEAAMARERAEAERRRAEEQTRRRAEEEAAMARERAEAERRRAEDTAKRLEEDAAKERERQQRQQAEEAETAKKAAEEQADGQQQRSRAAAERKQDLATKRNQAENWVKGYTATAVASVLGTSWVPGSSTAILCTLEATMCYHIGKIYKNEWSMQEAAAAAGVIGVAAFVGKLAAMEAMTFVPIVGWAAKSGIAGGVVWSMGQLVIKHFEDAY